MVDNLMLPEIWDDALLSCLVLLEVRASLTPDVTLSCLDLGGVRLVLDFNVRGFRGVGLVMTLASSSASPTLSPRLKKVQKCKFLIHSISQLCIYN